MCVLVKLFYSDVFVNIFMRIAVFFHSKTIIVLPTIYMYTSNYASCVALQRALTKTKDARGDTQTTS